jgi:hypothetical protein
MSRTCSGKKARLKMVDYFCYTVLSTQNLYWCRVKPVAQYSDVLFTLFPSLVKQNRIACCYINTHYNK